MASTWKFILYHLMSLPGARGEGSFFWGEGIPSGQVSVVAVPSGREQLDNIGSKPEGAAG